jgi:hypothetical protein
MNFVCLSPHFPPNFRAFWLRLAEAGVNVLGLADSPWSELGDPLQQALREYFRVGNMHDYDDLLRALGHFTYKYGKVDRIESHNEYWLETEAALRTDFNVTGPKRDDIGWVKRKSLMKQRFAAAGVPVARGRVVRDLVEAAHLAEEAGYPCVLKPDIGVGAAGAARVDSYADLERFFGEHGTADYMMEEFVEGTLCSFDGLAGPDGALLFYTAHVFNQGILQIVHGNRDMYYYSLRDIPPDLEAEGRKVVASFGLRDRFFHIEFFRRQDTGQLVVLEMNMRPPGGLTTDMFNYANDIDIYVEYARLITSGAIGSQPSRPFYCLYVGRKDHISYRHSEAEVLHRGAGLIVNRERVQSAFVRAIGDTAMLARCTDLEPLLDLTRFALEGPSGEL